MEQLLPSIDVSFVEASGPEASGEAFKALESHLLSLKGRKFYATFQYPDGPYRACVAIDGTSAPVPALPRGLIQGGLYAVGKLPNWTECPWEIPNVFANLSRDYSGRTDPSRPSIEFYKSQDELVLYLPLKA